MSGWPVAVALALASANVSAVDLPEPTILESWEGSAIPKEAGSADGWYISSLIHDTVVVTPSTEHVTSGRQSLRIDSEGGWSQVLIYRENSTDGKESGLPLSEQLVGKLTLNLDVFIGEELEWAKVEIAIQGNALHWTQLNTNSLPPGPTSLKYLIPPKVNAAIAKCDEWFQLVIIVNASSKGAVYIDSLGVE